MRKSYSYFVRRSHSTMKDKWGTVIGSQGNKSYALGWFHALTSFYPRPAYQFVRYEHPGILSILEESSTVSRPTPQRTN